MNKQVVSLLIYVDTYNVHVCMYVHMHVCVCVCVCVTESQ